MEGQKAAIYCRVDSGGSNETRQEALSNQKASLLHYAERKSFDVAGCYEDNGFSGHDLQRPGLVRLLRDYESGMFDVVLVVNRSRLFRGSRWDEPQWPFLVCSLNELEQNMER